MTDAARGSTFQLGSTIERRSPMGAMFEVVTEGGPFLVHVTKVGELYQAKATNAPQIEAWATTLVEVLRKVRERATFAVDAA